MHIRVLLPLLASILSGPAFACAELSSEAERWKHAVPGVEYVDNETWQFPCASKQPGYVVPTTRLTAFRFERKSFEFLLLNPAKELGSVDRKKHDLGGAFLNKRKQFIRFGQNIGTISEFTSEHGDLHLHLPAGWWQESDATQPDGYLKIDGEIVSQIFARSQNAVICLDDQSLRASPTVGNTIAVLFYYNKGRYAYANWSDRRKERLRECRNVFQTGPRVIEREQDQKELLSEPSLVSDPNIQCLANEDRNAGVCARASADSTPVGRQRVILAADDRPSRDLSEKRRYYIIYFHSELPLYQIQSILLTRRFYGDGEPEWAVNVAGGERVGMSVRFGSTYLQYGDLESDLPSILSVRRRR